MRIFLIIFLVLLTFFPIITFNKQSKTFYKSSFAAEYIEYEPTRKKNITSYMINSQFLTFYRWDSLINNNKSKGSEYLNELTIYDKEIQLLKESRGEITTDWASSQNAILLDVELIAQMPELPRGCEVTSLAMMLNYAGVKVDKITLAEEIKKVPYRENGLYGNPNDGFVGDMFNLDNDGFGVYHQPIIELADNYLTDQIVDLTGRELDDVLNYLNYETPIWVIINTWYTYVPDQYWESWETSSGKLKITRKEHSVLVTGFDKKFVYFNDPLTNMKNVRVIKTEFEKAFNQMGRQAVTYKAN